MVNCSTLVLVISAAFIYVPYFWLQNWSLDDPLYRQIAIASGDFVNVLGVPVHYKLEGPKDGELYCVRILTIYLHGISASAFVMRSIAQPIAKAGYRSLTFDFYGRGHSGVPIEDVKHDEVLLANQTAELLSTLSSQGIISENQFKKFHIVALSMGGSVAVVYSSQYPEKIKSLSLLAPSGLHFETPFSAKLGALPIIRDIIFPTNIGRLLMDRRVPAAFLEPSKHTELIKELTMINQYHFTRDEFIKAFTSTLVNFPLTNTTYAYEKVGKEKFPVLFIWGTEDHTVPIECAKQGLELIPRALLVTIPKAGHMALVETPKQVLEPLYTFLKDGTAKNSTQS